jgi:3-phenylpropionate/trans-cinnamate dioxygenase ferredoxin component
MPWKPTGVAWGAMPRGTMREVTIGPTTVLLVRTNDSVHAVDGICPHAGGLLADGELDGSRVRCPVHGALYDSTTGAVVEDPDGIAPPQGGTSPLARYPTRVRDGMIELEMP